MPEWCHRRWARAKLAVRRLIVWGNRQPQLTARRVFWVITGGLWLCLLYWVAALVLVLSLVFAPFAPQAFRVGLLALDGGITLEPRSRDARPLEQVPASLLGVQLSRECMAWQRHGMLHSCLPCSLDSPCPQTRPGLRAGGLVRQPRAPLHHRCQRGVGGAAGLAVYGLPLGTGAGAGPVRRGHRHRTD